MLHLLLDGYSTLTAKVDAQLDGVSKLNLILATLVTFYAVQKVVTTVQSLKRINKRELEKNIYNRFKTTPIIGSLMRSVLHQQTKKVVKDFYHEAAEAEKYWPVVRLPNPATSSTELEKIFRPVLQPMQQIVPEMSKVSGNIYTVYDEDFVKFLGSLMARTALLNPLHTTTLPIMARMEANLINICRELFNAKPTVGGAITHGGTTSIFEAMKAYTLYARNILRLAKPKVIVPSTVHVAFDKAAEILNIELIKIPVDPLTQMADLVKTEKAIDSATILLVGSAPNFMSGIIDPIRGLGKLAKKYNIGLHVDSCLGGFVTAFVSNPEIMGGVCDFRVSGVTSISADLHKYGGTAKGISMLLLGSMHYKSFGVNVEFPLDEQMAQAYTDWPGGFYVTKTLDGSRSLTPIVTALATLMHFGRNYYTDTTARLIQLKNDIVQNIETTCSSVQNHVFSYITVMGAPKLSIIAFKSDHTSVDIHKVATFMNKQRGWDLNLLQNPNSFHICLTAAHLQVPNTAQQFCLDLQDAVTHCKNNPQEKATGSAELYCAKGKVPVLAAPIMADVAKGFTRIMYSLTTNNRYHPFAATGSHKESGGIKRKMH